MPFAFIDHNSVKIKSIIYIFKEEIKWLQRKKENQ